MFSSHQVSAMMTQQNAMFSGMNAHSYNITAGMQGAPPVPVSAGSSQPVTYAPQAPFNTQAAARSIMGAGITAADMASSIPLGSMGLAAGGAGFSAGSAMAGGGLAGGLAGGAAGLSIGMLPLAAAGYGFNQLRSGMQESQAFNNVLQSEERGFSTGDRRNIEGAVRGLSKSRAMLSDFTELTKFTDFAMSNDFMKGVKDAEEFATRLTGMMKAARDISKTIGGSLQDAANFMNEIKGSGIGIDTSDPAKMSGMARSISTMAGVLDVDPGMLNQAMSQGSRLAWQAGGSLVAGSKGGRANFRDMSYLVKTGQISDAQIQELTGGVGGDQGLMMVSGKMNMIGQQMAHGRLGKALAAASAEVRDGEFTGGVNSDVVKRFQSGELSHGDLVKMAQENYSAGGGEGNFRMNKEEIQGNLGGEMTGFGSITMIKGLVDKHMSQFGKTSKKNLQSWMARKIGVNNDRFLKNLIQIANTMDTDFEEEIKRQMEDRLADQMWDQHQQRFHTVGGAISRGTDWFRRKGSPIKKRGSDWLADVSADLSSAGDAAFGRGDRTIRLGGWERDRMRGRKSYDFDLPDRPRSEQASEKALAGTFDFEAGVADPGTSTRAGIEETFGKMREIAEGAAEGNVESALKGYLTSKGKVGWGADLMMKRFYSQEKKSGNEALTGEDGKMSNIAGRWSKEIVEGRTQDSAEIKNRMRGQYGKLGTLFGKMKGTYVGPHSPVRMARRGGFSSAVTGQNFQAMSRLTDPSVTKDIRAIVDGKEGGKKERIALALAGGGDVTDSHRKVAEKLVNKSGDEIDAISESVGVTSDMRVGAADSSSMQDENTDLKDRVAQEEKLFGSDKAGKTLTASMVGGSKEESLERLGLAGDDSVLGDLKGAAGELGKGEGKSAAYAGFVSSAIMKGRKRLGAGGRLPLPGAGPVAADVNELEGMIPALTGKGAGPQSARMSLAKQMRGDASGVADSLVAGPLNDNQLEKFMKVWLEKFTKLEEDTGTPEGAEGGKSKGGGGGSDKKDEAIVKMMDLVAPAMTSMNDAMTAANSLSTKILENAASQDTFNKKVVDMIGKLGT